MGGPPLCEQPAHEAVERALAREDPDAARAALVALLETSDDPLATLTLRVLAQGPFAPDALAAAVDRLLTLVRAQEAQIRTLEALIETRL